MTPLHPRELPMFVDHLVAVKQPGGDYYRGRVRLRWHIPLAYNVQVYLVTPAGEVIVGRNDECWLVAGPSAKPKPKTKWQMVYTPLLAISFTFAAVLSGNDFMAYSFILCSFLWWFQFLRLVLK